MVNDTYVEGAVIIYNVATNIFSLYLPLLLKYFYVTQ